MELKKSIPSDWNVISVFEIADKQKARFDDGDWIEAEHITDKGVRLIQTGNIGIGGFVEKDAKKYVYDASFDLLKCKELKVGDLLICRLAEPAGRACILPNIGDAKVITSVDVTVFRPSPEKFNRGYLAQYFSTPQWFEAVLEQVGGTTHKRISKSALGKIPVPIPSELAEQSAIAEALGDVDDLLSGLDKLIAKKRDLKQAAMQQLLTGKTRLPGFGGDWKVARLGELGSTYGGLVGKSKNDFGHGIAQYVPFINVMANVVIDCEAFDTVDVGIGEIQNKVLKGDLLFNGSSETPEEVAMCALVDREVENLFLNSFCFGFRMKTDAPANGLFIAYYMRGPIGRELIKSLAQGSTRYNLSKLALLDGQLKLPSKDEQTAIAEVLSDMDAELATLEVRRDKTRLLKQGMMQELLTGKTRLV